MKYWKFKIITTILLSICLFTWIKLKTTWLDDEPSSKEKNYEAYYIGKLAEQLDGESEVTIKGGRIDILTDNHAIEVEWASKWKQSIGQALWYAMQKDTKPGIILLMKKPDDYIYFTMLNSALKHVDMEFETQYIEVFNVKYDDRKFTLK